MDHQPNSQPTPKKSRTVWLLLLVFVFLLIVDGLLFYGLVRRGLQNASSNTNRTVEIATADDPYKGGATAKVVIVEFGDFQCPYCLEAFPVVQEVASTYGDRIKFIYRDFPDSGKHPDAQKAAEASECAHEQGKFWEMHDKLFINQSDLSVAALKRYSQEISLDTAVFNSCLDTGKYAQEVRQDFNDGYQLGVRGTPTFFINGHQFEGTTTVENFQYVIDGLLSLVP